jgi:hypothetical protein
MMKARVGDLVRAGRQTASLTVNTFLRTEPLTGAAPVVVSLTSYGRRTRWVFLAIASIGAGAVRPQRLVLWLDEAQFQSRWPWSLRRLQRRGLEIRMAEDLGPHKKWYGYAIENPQGSLALVTADDDMMYPHSWLRTLIEEHAVAPRVVVAHRARRMRVSASHLAPYASWDLAPMGSTSFANFATGVGGVLYPADLVTRLAAQGRQFLESAPRADDVWLHACAFRAGFPTKRVAIPAGERFEPVRGSRSGGLFDSNVAGGGNDEQINRTYTRSELMELARVALETE